MNERPDTPASNGLPLLRGERTSPETLAPLALGVVLADMSLYPLTSLQGLRALGEFEAGQVAQSVASVAFAAVIPIVLTHRAVTAKRARDVVLRLVLAGVGYGFVSLFASLVRSAGGARAGGTLGAGTFDVVMCLVVQGVSLPAVVLGMVLAMGRPGATRDGDHRAALAAGTWMLWLAGPLRWSSFAGTWRVNLLLDPREWSIPLVVLGGALLWRGLAADRRLARRLVAVRAGEAEGWRIDPVDATTAALPALYDVPPAEPDGVLVDPAGDAVARVYQEGVDDANRLQRRAIGIAAKSLLSVLGLFALTYVLIFFLLPGRR